MTDKFNKENREAWERIRFSSYVTAQTQAYKKKYKITDIIKFPWDDEDKIITEKYEDISERMKLFQQRIDNSQNNQTKIAKFN